MEVFGKRKLFAYIIAKLSRLKLNNSTKHNNTYSWLKYQLSATTLKISYPPDKQMFLTVWDSL